MKHGRLIDADALKESLVTVTPEEDIKGNARRYCYPCREILKAIDNAPTIEERKTGKWIEDGYYDASCVCSHCGTDGQPDWNFCPNCGAKMEVEP